MEELRKKAAALRSALKERHSERNELRRELHKSHLELETLRLQAVVDLIPRQDLERRIKTLI